MKFAHASLALAFAATAYAQDGPYYDIQSKPFNLVLSSENKTIDGQYLAACHTGAAIESLCLAGIPSPSKPNNISYPTFQFNTSENSLPSVPDNGPPGVLTYLLRGGNFNVSSGLQIQRSLTSNVAFPLFYPGWQDSAVLNFDCEDRLNIEGSTDDGTNPWEAQPKAFYQWYSCLTNYGGYRYVTLAWVIPPGAPINPTCVKVDVKRVFV